MDLWTDGLGIKMNSVLHMSHHSESSRTQLCAILEKSSSGNGRNGCAPQKHEIAGHLGIFSILTLGCVGIVLRPGM